MIIKPRLIAVMGETASGKSQLAESLATELNGQLVNADAFQVYRGLDIGTSKPLCLEKYELLDLKNPEDSYGLGEWIRLVVPILERCYAANQSVVIVGGTGLYIRALLDGWQDMQDAPDASLREELDAKIEANGVESLFPELERVAPLVAAEVDPRNPVRVRRALEKHLTQTPPIRFTMPDFQIQKLCLDWSVAEIETRVNERVLQMLERGWIAEVRQLLHQGVSPDCPAFRAIGYISIAKFLEGQLSQEELVSEISLRTRQYAKRQRTWLRSEKGLKRVSGVELLGANDLKSLLNNI